MTFGSLRKPISMGQDQPLTIAHARVPVSVKRRLLVMANRRGVTASRLIALILVDAMESGAWDAPAHQISGRLR